MAKSLLSSYQRESGNAVYGEFASMLDNVDVNMDVIKVVGDVQLEVSGSEQNTVSYMWTYVDANGVLAAYTVCLCNM
jgi:hypothetical protein